jgi:hypothetical protein
MEIAMRGTVDRVVANSGFGFLIGPNGEEYFFHRTGLMGPEFDELGPGVTPDEHLRAVNIRLADDAIPAVDNEPLPAEKISGEE